MVRDFLLEKLLDIILNSPVTGKQTSSSSGSSSGSAWPGPGQPREDVDLKFLRSELQKRKEILEGLRTQSQNRRSPMGEEANKVLRTVGEENR